MAQSNKDDRRERVLEAAAQLVRDARVDWSSSLTFGDLAEASEMDVAQISRDFGSKDQLLDALVHHLLGPHTTVALQEHVTSVADDVVDAGFSMNDALVRFGEADAEFREREADEMRARMLLWAAAGEGSTEWEALGSLYRQGVAHQLSEAQSIVDIAVANGAKLRDELSLEEVLLVIGAVIGGLMVRRSVVPELVSDDLVSRVLRVLLTGAVGSDARGPFEDLENVKLI